MNHSLPHTDCSSAKIPDCVKCLRKKINALGVVVFARSGSDWYVAGYEGDKPAEDAEVEAAFMNRVGVPSIIAAHANGLVLNDNASIEKIFSVTNQLLFNKSIVAAPLKFHDFSGVRLAWRDSSQPFTKRELELLQCVSDCPSGCV